MSDTAAFEASLEKVGSKSSWWLWGIFALCALPGAFNSAHIMSIIFLKADTAHWCSVKELEDAGWTQKQIRDISSQKPQENNNCFKYDWNYTQFVSMGFTESLEFTKKAGKMPELVECDSFAYDESKPKSSIVSEWDLVCDRSHLQSFSQSIVAIGKFVGGFVFGMISDKFGRKISFMIASLLYIIAGPVAAIVPYFILFSTARFCIGLAGAGCYGTSYTILTEIAAKDYRTLFACIFNISYPIGYILLPLAAYLASDWRQTQLYISLPLLLLILYIWLLPESPRWLLSQGKTEKAWRVLKRAGEQTAKDRQPQPAAAAPAAAAPSQGERKSCCEKFLECLKGTFSLCGSLELLKRTTICYFAWFSAGLCYFVIALSSDNFSSNKFIYCALCGAAEAPGYVLSFICLITCGRKPVGTLLFLISGVSLLVISTLPRDAQAWILVMALLGRFCISAVFAVIILHTSELFPTVNRNSAIGTSLTSTQLGVIAAPYVVQFMGQEPHWYLPSIFCGIMSILTALFDGTLPETKDKPMPDAVADIEDQEDKVSCFSICKMCLCR